MRGKLEDKIWNRPLGKFTYSLPGPSLQSDDGLVRRLKHTKTLTGHRGPVTSISWSTDGQFLISAGDDTLLKIWDVNGREGRETTIDSGHFAGITCVRFLPGNTKVVSCGSDRQVRVVDLTKGAVKPFTAHKSGVKAVAPIDTDVILSAAEDGRVRRLDVRERGPARGATQSALDEFASRSLLVEQHQESNRGLAAPIRVGISCLSVDPLAPHVFATAGSDTLVRAYDMRMLRQRQPGVSASAPAWTHCYAPNHLFKSPFLSEHSTPWFRRPVCGISGLSYSHTGNCLVASYTNEGIYTFNCRQDARSYESLHHAPPESSLFGTSFMHHASRFRRNALDYTGLIPMPINISMIPPPTAAPHTAGAGTGVHINTATPSAAPPAQPVRRPASPAPAAAAGPSSDQEPREMGERRGGRPPQISVPSPGVLSAPQPNDPPLPPRPLGMRQHAAHVVLRTVSPAGQGAPAMYHVERFNTFDAAPVWPPGQGPQPAALHDPPASPGLPGYTGRLPARAGRPPRVPAPAPAPTQVSSRQGGQPAAGSSQAAGGQAQQARPAPLLHSLLGYMSGPPGSTPQSTASQHMQGELPASVLHDTGSGPPARMSTAPAAPGRTAAGVPTFGTGLPQGEAGPSTATATIRMSRSARQMASVEQPSTSLQHSSQDAQGQGTVGVAQGSSAGLLHLPRFAAPGHDHVTAGGGQLEESDRPEQATAVQPGRQAAAGSSRDVPARPCYRAPPAGVQEEAVDEEEEEEGALILPRRNARRQARVRWADESDPAPPKRRRVSNRGEGGSAEAVVDAVPSSSDAGQAAGSGGDAGGDGRNSGGALAAARAIAGQAMQAVTGWMSSAVNRLGSRQLEGGSSGGVVSLEQGATQAMLEVTQVQQADPIDQPGGGAGGAVGMEGDGGGQASAAAAVAPVSKPRTRRQRAGSQQPVSSAHLQGSGTEAAAGQAPGRMLTRRARQQQEQQAAQQASADSREQVAGSSGAAPEGVPPDRSRTRGRGRHAASVAPTGLVVEPAAAPQGSAGVQPEPRRQVLVPADSDSSDRIMPDFFDRGTVTEHWQVAFFAAPDLPAAPVPMQPHASMPAGPSRGLPAAQQTNPGTGAASSAVDSQAADQSGVAPGMQGIGPQPQLLPAGEERPVFPGVGALLQQGTSVLDAVDDLSRGLNVLEEAVHNLHEELSMAAAGAARQDRHMQYAGQLPAAEDRHAAGSLGQASGSGSRAGPSAVWRGQRMNGASMADVGYGDQEQGPAEGAQQHMHMRCFTSHCNKLSRQGVSWMGAHSEYVVSGSDLGHVHIWDAATGSLVVLLTADEDNPVEAVQPHPFELSLASIGGEEQVVKLWEPRDEPVTALASRARASNLAVQDLPAALRGRVGQGQARTWQEPNTMLLAGLLANLHSRGQREVGDEAGGGGGGDADEGPGDEDVSDSEASPRDAAWGARRADRGQGAAGPSQPAARRGAAGSGEAGSSRGPAGSWAGRTRSARRSAARPADGQAASPGAGRQRGGARGDLSVVGQPWGRGGPGEIPEHEGPEEEGEDAPDLHDLINCPLM